MEYGQSKDIIARLREDLVSNLDTYGFYVRDFLKKYRVGVAIKKLALSGI